jgi:hypothetical protein
MVAKHVQVMSSTGEGGGEEGGNSIRQATGTAAWSPSLLHTVSLDGRAFSLSRCLRAQVRINPCLLACSCEPSHTSSDTSSGG